MSNIYLVSIPFADFESALKTAKEASKKLIYSVDVLKLDSFDYELAEVRVNVSV